MKGEVSLGEFAIHRISKFERAIGPALDIFPRLNPDTLSANRAWMIRSNSMDDNDNLIMSVQGYVVRTPDHTVLIDSCIGNNKSRPSNHLYHMKVDDVFMRSLDSAGYRPDEIDLVICTHFHADHVGWNTSLTDGRWVPTFPNARYIFSKIEYDYWNELNRNASVTAFSDSIIPIVEAGIAEFVDGEAKITDYIRILPTPGHTPGHVSVAIGRDKDDFVFCGDVMHSPIQALHPDLSSKWAVNPSQSAATRRRLLEHYCGSPTFLLPSHFSASSFGTVSSKGDGFLLIA
jgi:glyoxylase-like metal-dependent hydrolase (beta-lactamase superfamily II)